MSTMAGHQIQLKWLYHWLQISINPNLITTIYLPPLYTGSKWCDVFIKSLLNHHDGFNINNFIKFITRNTCSALSNKLQQTRSIIIINKKFYFNCLPTIPKIWNILPVIDLNDHPTRIKNKLLEYLWKYGTITSSYRGYINDNNSCNHMNLHD